MSDKKIIIETMESWGNINEAWLLSPECKTAKKYIRSIQKILSVGGKISNTTRQKLVKTQQFYKFKCAGVKNKSRQAFRTYTGF